MADEPKPGEGVDARGGPVVDPTKNVLDLVAAAMERQDDLRGAAGSLFRALIDGLQRYIDTRIDGHIRLSTERAVVVQREFDNIERRRIEHKNDTKIAVDAAFTAAKEAVKEQAAASDKAIQKSESTVSGQIKAVEGTVDDLKDRIGKLETQQQTKMETRVESRSNTGMIVGILGSIFGFLMIVVVVVVAILRGAGQ